MSESLKGFHTVLMRDPPRINVGWDRITQADFNRVEVVWWCLGDHETENVSRWIDSSQFLIDVNPGKTYMIAAQAHFMVDPLTGIAGHYSTKWAYTVVEVPLEEPQHEHWLHLAKYLKQHTPSASDVIKRAAHMGWAEVIDTPKGPAILLDDLRDAFSQ